MPISISGLKKLDGEDRFYEWNGDRYISVTSVIKSAIPKPGLQKWQLSNVARAAASERAATAELSDEETQKHVLSFADGGALTKANLGTEVHAYAEATALGKTPPEPTPEAKPYVDAFEAFLYDVKPIITCVELPVINKTYGYAGTVDAYMVINGKESIVDIKTTKSIWPEVSLQLAAYSRAEFGIDGGVQTELPVVGRGYVLHISPYKYELRRVAIDDSAFDGFTAALDLYRWLRNDSPFAIGGLLKSGEISEQ